MIIDRFIRPIKILSVNKVGAKTNLSSLSLSAMATSVRSDLARLAALLPALATRCLLHLIQGESRKSTLVIFSCVRFWKKKVLESTLNV